MGTHMASGQAETKEACKDSGTQQVSNPTPERKTARAHMRAAPPSSLDPTIARR